MLDSIKPLAGLYQVNGSLVKRVLRDLSDSQLQERPGPDANSMQWILGHIVSSRFSILRLLGSKSENPFGDLFSKGAEPKDQEDYPSVEELKEKWAEVTQELNTLLEEISEETLQKTIERKFPGMESTVKGGITFLQFHETYHIGQLAYIRRLHNQSQLVG